MSLDYMAQAFGVSTTFIDKELASFITAGRIHAKIDKGKIPPVQVGPKFSNFSWSWSSPRWFYSVDP